MLRIFYAPTPNGWKVTILLEELGVPYELVPVRLAQGEQHREDFLEIAPNNKIPAMVDDAPPFGGRIALMESGAIMTYLADKHGRFLPKDGADRWTTLQWLMWQMAGLGPMLGQHGHFLLYADRPVPYAQARFRNEGLRLYGVLDRQLSRTGAFIAGEAYSIADMACFPWVMTHKKQQFDLADFPHVRRWFAEVRARPAVQRGVAAGRELFDVKPAMTEAERRRLFGLDPVAQPVRGESST